MIKPGRVYDIQYKCRDIGYGVEEGLARLWWTGEYVIAGKLELFPVHGGDPLYLFKDEIESYAPAWVTL